MGTLPLERNKKKLAWQRQHLLPRESRAGLKCSLGEAHFPSESPAPSRLPNNE